MEKHLNWQEYKSEGYSVMYLLQCRGMCGTAKWWLVKTATYGRFILNTSSLWPKGPPWARLWPSRPCESHINLHLSVSLHSKLVGGHFSFCCVCWERCRFFLWECILSWWPPAVCGGVSACPPSLRTATVSHTVPNYGVRASRVDVCKRRCNARLAPLQNP